MSSATVSTLTDVELIVMSRSEFSTLFETVGTFRRRIVKELASRTGVVPVISPATSMTKG